MKRKPVIKITFTTTTPESAEQGDYAETGWIDEEGVSMVPDKFDEEDGLTITDLAIDFLNYNGACFPSSSHFHYGVWYSDEGYTDFRTGKEEQRSYHLYDFTQEEERIVFNAISN